MSLYIIFLCAILADLSLAGSVTTRLHKRQLGSAITFKWVKLHSCNLPESISDDMVRIINTNNPSNPSRFCRPYYSSTLNRTLYLYERYQSDNGGIIERLECSDNTCSQGCSLQGTSWVSKADGHAPGQGLCTVSYFEVVNPSDDTIWTKSEWDTLATSAFVQATTLYAAPVKPVVCSNSHRIQSFVRHHIFENCVAINTTHFIKSFLENGSTSTDARQITTRLCMDSACSTSCSTLLKIPAPLKGSNKPICTAPELSSNEAIVPVTMMFPLLTLSNPISSDYTTLSLHAPTLRLLASAINTSSPEPADADSGSTGGFFSSPIAVGVYIAVGVCVFIVLVVFGIRAFLRINFESPKRTTIAEKVVVVHDQYGSNYSLDDLEAGPPNYNSATGNAPVVYHG
ncbi:hypothetical protein BDV3_007321 [Batrachochytrium dendrobatidis]